MLAGFRDASGRIGMLLAVFCDNQIMHPKVIEDFELFTDVGTGLFENGHVHFAFAFLILHFSFAL